MYLKMRVHGLCTLHHTLKSETAAKDFDVDFFELKRLILLEHYAKCYLLVLHYILHFKNKPITYVAHFELSALHEYHYVLYCMQIDNLHQHHQH